VDIIYALDPVSVGLPALFASQICDKKFILRIAGDYAWEQGTQRFGVIDKLDDFAENYSQYSWQVKFLKKIQTYTARGAEKIIVPSEYLKKIVSAWNVDMEKIRVIYNGFHIESIKETPSVLRKKLKFSGNVIISVGRLVPWKGMRELIDIMPQVINSISDAKLIIIGDGPEKNNLEEAVKNLNINDKVIFAGRLDQKKLFEYIKAADLFVLNTSYEGFSHQIIETMALNTPVITTAVGGNTEVIRNGDNGILVQSGAKNELLEAITGLLLDSKKAETLAKKAKKDVSRFTDEFMLSQISEELKK
jgi:glycosyltransferase involved in cell wall biosynthesis